MTHPNDPDRADDFDRTAGIEAAERVLADAGLDPDDLQRDTSMIVDAAEQLGQAGGIPKRATLLAAVEAAMLAMGYTWEEGDPQ
jgi:hypothetical protein